MQYILTEEEYRALHDKAAKGAVLPDSKAFDKLCQKIADAMPIRWPWGPSKDKLVPWGCIYTKTDWHCDECPVRTICRMEKDYSK